MLKTLLQVIALAVTLIFFTGCSPLPQAAPWSPSPVPTSTSTPSAEILDLAETLEADPGYLASCRSEYPTGEQSQAGYEGIYPGISTSQETQELLGPPEQKIQCIEREVNWLYGSDLTVVLEKNLVSWIDVSPSKPLQYYLELYGCPDIVFALDRNQHPYGDYDALLLVYHTLGLEMIFGDITLRKTDTPLGLAYYPQGTLAKYFDNLPWLNDSAKVKPVQWEDTVK